MIWIWYDMVWYGMRWYGMIWYEMSWYYHMMSHDELYSFYLIIFNRIFVELYHDMITTSYDMMWYDMIWYDMIW